MSDIHDNCSICLEALEEGTTELEECHHSFHTTCIVKWFRSQHVTCPLCKGIPNTVLTAHNAETRFKQLQKEVRRKDAPDILKKAFKKLAKVQMDVQKRRAKRKAIALEVKKLRKHPKVVEFLNKQKKTKCIHNFRDRRKIKNTKYLIGVTDFGTGLGALSSVPMMLAQVSELDNGDRFFLT
jgi:hypothetical protein